MSMHHDLGDVGVASTLRRDGRVAGALYLVVVLSGMFCLAWVPSQLGVGAASAAAQVDVFRAGIAAFLLMQVAFLLLPLAMYRVLGDSNRHTAAAMVALATVSVPIGLAALGHRLDAGALLESIGQQSAASVDAAFQLSLQRYGHGIFIAKLFWGLWLLPFGWLVLRSGRLPRVLGLLLLLGGVGYVVQVVGGLVPGFANSALSNYATMPAALGEIGSCLWLLLFGARVGVVRTHSA